MRRSAGNNFFWNNLRDFNFNFWYDFLSGLAHFASYFDFRINFRFQNDFLNSYIRKNS